MESHRGLRSQGGLPTWDEPKIIEYHSTGTDSYIVSYSIPGKQGGWRSTHTEHTKIYRGYLVHDLLTGTDPTNI